MEKIKSTITTILLILAIIAVLGACVSLLKLSPVAKKINNSGSVVTDPTAVPADKFRYNIHVYDAGENPVYFSIEDISIYAAESSQDLGSNGQVDNGNCWSGLFDVGEYTFTLNVFNYQSYTGTFDVDVDDLGDVGYTSVYLTTAQGESGSEDENQNVCTYRISAIDSVTNNSVSLEMCEPNIYFTSDQSVSTEIQGNLSDVWLLSIPNVGEYTFTISLSGYETYTGTLTVTSADIGLERMTTITLVPANV